MAFHFQFIEVLWDRNSHGGLAVTGLGRLSDSGRRGGCALTLAPATFLL